MPYAADNKISHSPIEGGIEITLEQYRLALSGMLEGKLVSIDGGFNVVDPPAPEAAPEVPPEDSPQPAPVPQQCSGRQGQKALLRTPYGEGSNMLAAVKALIASIPDDFMREDAELDFNAATWERKNPTLQALWAQLGGTDEQLDDLFVLAVTL